MAKLNFAINLYTKYWPDQYKDPVYLDQTIRNILASKSITIDLITFVSVPTDPVTNPEGAKVVATVAGASAIDNDLSHDSVKSYINTTTGAGLG